MARRDDFHPSVPLPPGLDVAAIRRAIDYIERQLADLVDIYFEQANVFSGIVGIYGTKALDAVSNYEKHRHIDAAQQRLPDLRRRGTGFRPSPNESLESKGSKRPWAIQSHYDHPGWFIVWRYMIDPTESLEAAARSSSGASTWCFSTRTTGSTKRAAPAMPAEGGRIHLE